MKIKSQQNVFAGPVTLRKLASTRFWPCRLNEKQLTYLHPLKGVPELDLGLSDPVSEAALAELKGLANVRSLTTLGIGPVSVSVLRDLRHLEYLDTAVHANAGGKVDLSALRDLRWLRIFYVDPSQAPLRLPAGLGRLDIDTISAASLDLNSAASIKQLQVKVEFLPRASDDDGRRDDLKWLRRLPELRKLTVTHADREQIKEIAELTNLRSLAFFTKCVSLSCEEDLKLLAGLRKLSR